MAEEKTKVEKIADRVSKKLTLATAVLAWLVQAPLPDEQKAKYMVYVALGFIVIQGLVDLIKAWRGGASMKDLAAVVTETVKAFKEVKADPVSAGSRFPAGGGAGGVGANRPPSREP